MLIRLGFNVLGLPPGVNSFGLPGFGAVLRNFCAVVRLGFEVLGLPPRCCFVWAAPFAPVLIRLGFEVVGLPYEAFAQ